MWAYILQFWLNFLRIARYTFVIESFEVKIARCEIAILKLFLSRPFNAHMGLPDWGQELATQGVKALLDKLAVSGVKQTKPKQAFGLKSLIWKAT